MYLHLQFYYVVTASVSIYNYLVHIMLCIELVCFPFTVVTVGFELTNYTVLESETATNVCVVSTGEIERMFDVMIFTPDTSSGKQSLHSCRLWCSIIMIIISNIPHSLDYSLIPENIIFSPGMTGPQCQSISITDDSILENDEVFMVALSTTDQDIILSPSTTSVTIVNDDGNLFMDYS